jgi:hypothetical protein
MIQTRSSTMHVRHFLVAATAFVLSVCSPPNDSPESELVAVLQHLMASNANGHLERYETYCAGRRDGASLTQSELANLEPFAARIVQSAACDFVDSLEVVVVREDATPSVFLWADWPDESERRRYTVPELYGVPVEDASLVMAGFYRNPTDSADFICWVTTRRPMRVLICDLVSIS